MIVIDELKVVHDITNMTSRVEARFYGDDKYLFEYVGTYTTKKILMSNAEIMSLIRGVEFSSHSHAFSIIKEIFSGRIDYGKLYPGETFIKLEKARELILDPNFSKTYYIGKIFLINPVEGYGVAVLNLPVYNSFGIMCTNILFNVKPNVKNLNNINRFLEKFNYNFGKKGREKIIGIEKIVEKVCTEAKLSYAHFAFNNEEILEVNTAFNEFKIVGISTTFTDTDSNSSYVRVDYCYSDESNPISKDFGKISNYLVGKLNSELKKANIESLAELNNFMENFKKQ